MRPPVYLDYAATTPVRPEVLEAMLPYLTDRSFGNPSSGHRFGRAARAGVEQARRQIAEALGAEPSQVIFTSGGTEADNLGIVGAALAARERGAEMCAAVSAIEHKAVLAAAHAVTHLGGREVTLAVDQDGLLELEGLDSALAQSPAVVSVMWVNNEVGMIQPVNEIAGRCREAGVVFHTDAVQAVGKVPVSLSQLPCTLLTISGHKIGAPKGIGALLVRDRKAVEAIIHGGGQQFGLRPGTENVAGAVALGRAVQLAAAEQDEVARRLAALRDELSVRLKTVVPDVVINCERSPRAPHLLSAAFPGTDSEALLMHLDLAGVAVSSGSACSTGAVEPSHVLVAMGVSRDLALGTIRFSLGRETTLEDIERAVEVVPGVVEKVRKLAGVLGRAGGQTVRRSDGQAAVRTPASELAKATTSTPDRAPARPPDRPPAEAQP
jgi:cysteine desulfurase